jgi:hypothetical protein
MVKGQGSYYLISHHTYLSIKSESSQIPTTNRTKVSYLTQRCSAGMSENVVIYLLLLSSLPFLHPMN